MKAALALMLVALVGGVAAVVLVVANGRDATVGSVRSCLRDAGARLVKGTDGLGPLRADLAGGTLRAAGARRLRDGDRALLLSPDDGLYLAAVVTQDAPSAAAVLRAVAERPEGLPAVAWAPRAAADGLRGCLEISARKS